MKWLTQFLEERTSAAPVSDHNPRVIQGPVPVAAGGTTRSATSAVAADQSRRLFVVAIDGSTSCPRCGEKGRIPHHLSLIFWTYWSRDRLGALTAAMRPDERLAWLGHGRVRLEGVAGTVRFLHEHDGRWSEEEMPPDFWALPRKASTTKDPG